LSGGGADRRWSKLTDEIINLYRNRRAGWSGQTFERLP
jgi:hypothetical protein